jgi:protein-ribulosamine 3-kinase
MIPAGRIEAVLGTARGEPVHVRAHSRLGGGSDALVELIHTNVGDFVLKAFPGAPDARARLAGEAAGLAALGAATASLVVPCPITDWQPEPFLLMEYLAVRRPARDIDAQLGRALAELHRAGPSTNNSASSGQYGFVVDTWCGATKQPNPWCDSWCRFYAEARLGWQIEMASTRGYLTSTDRTCLQHIVDRLDDLLMEPPEGPALIHGDLWAGNVLATPAGPAVIDPAVSYAHREMEFGMTTLFGGLGRRGMAAYQEVWPLDDGWEQRLPLYQLYHLLNHLNLFGPGYHGQVMEIARRYT